MTDAPVEVPLNAPTPARSPRRDDWLWAGLLVLLTLIVYQPAIRGAFLWDDDRHVSQNRALRSASGLADIWLHPSTGRTLETGYVTPQYYPLTHTTYWLEYHVWGLNTVGYHAVNILLHAASALLLWQLLKMLRVPGAWVAAAIFAVHPIEVESVAWITERKNVLSGLFFFASLYAYVRFAGMKPAATKEQGGEVAGDGAAGPLSWGWYALSFLLFGCAVLSKTVASAMPVVALLLLWWKLGRRLNWRTVAGVVPFLVVGAILGRQTAWMEKYVVGAIGPDWDLSFAQRVLVAGHAFWFYLGKIVWPVGLTFTYPRWVPDPADRGQWVYPIAAAVVILAALAWALVGKRSRGVAVAVLAYAVLLFPAMGFFDVYPMRFSFVADHFQYLAGVAVICGIVGLLASWLWRGERGAGAQVVQGIAGVVVFVLAVMTWRQSAIYDSPTTLWDDTLAKNPNSWMGHYNLGIEEVRLAAEQRAAGDAESANKSLAESASHFERATVLRPGHANAYANWGIVLLDMNRLPEATEKLKKSIELDPTSDDPHLTLGLVYLRQRKPAEARAEWEKALSLDPKSWRAMVHLADLDLVENKLPAAEASYRAAVALRPRDASIQHALAATLAREKKSREALMHAGLAAELQPTNAEYMATLGYLWAENGRPSEAFEAFKRALQIDPNNARALEGAKTLVTAMAEMRRAATRPATTRSATMPATREATTGPSTAPAVATVPMSTTTAPAATTVPAATGPVR